MNECSYSYSSYRRSVLFEIHGVTDRQTDRQDHMPLSELYGAR